jgi:hypothetical protein
MVWGGVYKSSSEQQYTRSFLRQIGKDGVRRLRPAKHSYSGFAAARLVMSFPRACLARARNPESGAWAGEKTGILRAAATCENDTATNPTRSELSP